MNEQMDPLKTTPLDAETIEVPTALIQELFDSQRIGAFAFKLGAYQGELTKVRSEIDGQPHRHGFTRDPRLQQLADLAEVYERRTDSTLSRVAVLTDITKILSGGLS